MKTIRVGVFFTAAMFCLLNLLSSPAMAYKFKNLQKIYMLNKIINYKDIYCSENKNSKIYYTTVDRNYVSTVKIAVDTYYPLLLDDFNLERSEKVCIIIHPSKESILMATSADKAPMGAYFGGIIHILSPSLWVNGDDEHTIKNIFLREGPLIHEMTHFITDLKTNGNYPLWFTEGVALYYEYKYTGAQWREDLSADVKNISYGELSQNFIGLDEALAYRKAFETVNGIVLTFGEDKLQEIIGSHRREIRKLTNVFL